MKKSVVRDPRKRRNPRPSSSKGEPQPSQSGCGAVIATPSAIILGDAPAIRDEGLVNTCETEIRVRVVAIGASAGGLEAIGQFFDVAPADSGLAFVIVQHLSPDFRSLMDQLLARHSSMSIRRALDGTKIERNFIYLNAPRTELTLSDGVLYAREVSEAETAALPIDIFLRSLALDQKESAVAIIMSGAGSDGALGAAAIREAGGTVFAQDPASAKFGSMPQTIIERGLANVRAVPSAMPEVLQRLMRGEDVSEREVHEGEAVGSHPEREILDLLHRRYGADFGYYKPSTVQRRIRRRSLLNRQHGIATYAEFLKTNPTELEELYCDLLIGVTAFFRDSEAYASLALNVFPRLLAEMSPTRQIRVWVPGCASGEEPYTIAIMLQDFANQHGLTLNVKIFATDLHFGSLDIAGTGMYSADRINTLPSKIVGAYFDKVGDNYRVKQQIRRFIVFSAHNLIKDPPLTRMDLISCRNLLIYFDNAAQKKVLAYFHFSLHNGGVLMLGPSESTGGYSNEFETIDKHWRIYRKTRDVRLRESTNLLPFSGDQHGLDHHSNERAEVRHSWSSSLPALTAHRQALARAYDVMLERYAPAGLLIDKSGKLVHVFGDAARYLRISHGVFKENAIDLLHKDLRLVVNAALERIRKQNGAISSRNVKVHLEGRDDTVVGVVIEELLPEGLGSDFLLVTLKDEKRPDQSRDPHGDLVDSKFFAQRVQDLERDLKSSEDILQNAIEELKVTNEELLTTNEELMASNEELQSTNEELNSANEELYIVSGEHQKKIDELTGLTNDMENLLRSTDIGTIFLDTELRIRRFTPAAARAFNLLPHDEGRPIQHITYQFSYDTLVRDIMAVKASRSVSEREIEVEGRSALLRILPYQTQVAELDGVVLTVFDVNELRTVRDELDRERDRFRTLYMRTPVMMYSVRLSDLTIIEVNDYWLKVMGYGLDEVRGESVLSFLTPASREYAESAVLFELRASGRVENIPLEFVRKNGSTVDVRLTSMVDERADDANQSFTWIVDVTDQLKAERALEARNAELARINEKLQQFAYIVSHDLSGPLRAIRNTTEWIAEDLGCISDELIVDHLSRLRGQIAHLTGMLSDLLDYSTAGIAEIETQEIQLGEMLVQTFEAVDNPLRLKFAVECNPGTILGCRAPLLMALRNLIENAVKHNDREEGRITVRLNDKGDKWLFSVEDDGPGIEANVQDKIFLPFRKLVRKDRVPGNGMGLAIVKKIVEAAGGELSVISDPSVRPGAIFRFTWPKLADMQFQDRKTTVFA